MDGPSEFVKTQIQEGAFPSLHNIALFKSQVSVLKRDGHKSAGIILNQPVL